MQNFYFDTDGFQDSEERLKENFNEVGGFALCELLQSALKGSGFQVEEIFPEDYGWAFDASINEIRYFCSASVDPVDEDEQGQFSHFANLNIERKRSFLEKLRGRNKIDLNDPAVKAVHSALDNHTDVQNLKSSLF